MRQTLKKNSTQYVKSFKPTKLSGKTSKYGKIFRLFFTTKSFSMNNIEHNNGRMMKEMSHLTKQFQRLKSSYDNLLDKNKQLEKRSDEQETIIEHMREIVFNDTSEDSG